MITADYQYLVDWNNDGGFDHAESDISADVLNASFNRGNQDGRPGTTGAGQLHVVLDNSNGKYSPDNAASPITGLVLPFRRVQFMMDTGSSSELFCGYLEDIVPDASDHTRVAKAQLTAYGIITKLQGDTANVELQETISTGRAIMAALAAGGYSSADYFISEGMTTLAKWWMKPGTNLLAAMRSLEAAEIGHLAENPAGQLIFHDRGHAFVNSRGNTVQATYGTGTLNLWRLKRLSSRAGIYNYAAAKVRTFNVSETDVLLALLTDVPNAKGGIPVIVPAGGSKTINIDYPTPGSPTQYIAVNEWGIVDYTANTAADGSGTDITSDVSAVKTAYGSRLQVVFTNANGSDAHLIVLRAWGKAQIEGDPIALESYDSTSIGKYGRKPWPVSLDWETNQADCQDKLDYIVAEYKDPKARITFEVEGNYDAAHLAEVQARREGDRIKVTASLAEFGLAIDAEFIVDGVRHVVDETRKHTMTLWCTAAPLNPLLPDGVGADSNEIPEQDNVPVNVPDQLVTRALALESTLLIMAQAKKWNAGIDQAELRLQRVESNAPVVFVDMRTPAEGGAFADNGTTQRIITDLFADWQGFRYEFEYGAYTGEWYWSMRFRNADGWSNWTDGNDVPQYVTHHVNTAGDALYDVGAPADWAVKIKPGIQAGTAVVVASRPAVNSNRIWQVDYQIRDASAGAGSPQTGFWRDLDADAGAAETLYDGSAIDHIYNPATGELRKATGNYGDAATNGGLLVIDVRQGQFDIQRTIWQRVAADQFDGETISGIQPFNTSFAKDANEEYTGLRIKIVRPPWNWNATEPAANDDGFQDVAGYQANPYWDNPTYGDLNTSVFYSNPFIIPAGLTINDLEARVFFTNTYCTTDGGITSDPAETVATQQETKIIVGPILIDGDGSQPGAGYHGAFPVAENCYLESVTMFADASGTFEIDLRKSTFTDWPPDSGDSITGANPPELNSAQKYRDETLAGWTRALLAGDVISLYIQAGAATVTKVWVTLIFSRTTLVGTDEPDAGVVLATPWGYWPMDEISQFTVPTAPALLFGGSGSGLAARRLYAKTTFELNGVDESLANGAAFGPLFIPGDKYLRGSWQLFLKALEYSTRFGAYSGVDFEDSEADDLDYIRVCGFKLGEDTAIHYFQMRYEKADGSKVYGTRQGPLKSNTNEHTVDFDDDEYVTQIQGSWATVFGIPIYINSFTITTNKATYSYNTPTGNTFTFVVTAPGTGFIYEFMGLFGRQTSTNPESDFNRINSVGIILRRRYYDTAQAVPQGATGWNLYTSTDGVIYSKENIAAIDLDNNYLEV